MKSSLPLWGQQVKGCFKISLTVFIFFVITLISGSLYVIDNYTIGYKYYVGTEIIGRVKQKNLLENTIADYLKQLEGDNYSVQSIYTDVSYKKSIIRKDLINENEVSQLINKKINVIINITKVKIKEDLFYFKNETDANTFISNLEQYIKQEYNIESGNGSIGNITSDYLLENKIQEVKAEKDKIIKQQQEQVKKRIIYSASRSYYKRYSPPMKSYVMISSYYGWRSRGWHSGVDFAAAANTEIYAWKDGIVTFAGWSGNYGYFIIVQHNDNTISRYAHCNKIVVEENMEVTAGQLIGYVGSTGRSRGPHLHLEILIDGKMVNPLDYIN